MIGETESLYNQAVALSIAKWDSLPSGCVNARIKLLQTFQQVVELQESSLILVEVNNTARGSQGSGFAELKHILQTWRERLPNKWDSISTWNDLLAWRNHIFMFATQSAAHGGGDANHPLSELGMHETIHSVLKFSRTARKHGLPEVCIQCLSQIFRYSPVRPQEQFMRLREQLKCQLQMATPHTLQQGFEILRNTNVEYYDEAQKASHC